jgi:hypothetical protein
METKLEKQARYLQTYIIPITLLCGMSLIANFSQLSRKISINCITFSEKNGKMTMILTLPAGITADGEETVTKTVEGRYPGTLFYN